MELERISQDDLQSYSLDETKDIVLGKRGVLTREIYEAELKLELVAEKIRELRKQRNLSQSEKSQISKIEKGNQNITIETLLKVFHALQANISLKIEVY